MHFISRLRLSTALLVTVMAFSGLKASTTDDKHLQDQLDIQALEFKKAKTALVMEKFTKQTQRISKLLDESVTLESKSKHNASLIEEVAFLADKTFAPILKLLSSTRKNLEQKFQEIGETNFLANAGEDIYGSLNTIVKEFQEELSKIVPFGLRVRLPGIEGDLDLQKQGSVNYTVGNGDVGNLIYPLNSPLSQLFMTQVQPVKVFPCNCKGFYNGGITKVFQDGQNIVIEVDGRKFSTSYSHQKLQQQPSVLTLKGEDGFSTLALEITPQIVRIQDIEALTSSLQQLLPLGKEPVVIPFNCQGPNDITVTPGLGTLPGPQNIIWDSANRTFEKTDASGLVLKTQIGTIFPKEYFFDDGTRIFISNEPTLILGKPFQFVFPSKTSYDYTFFADQKDTPVYFPTNVSLQGLQLLGLDFQKGDVGLIVKEKITYFERAEKFVTTALKRLRPDEIRKEQELLLSKREKNQKDLKETYTFLESDLSHVKTLIQ